MITNQAGSGSLLALWRDAQARGWIAVDNERGWRWSSPDQRGTMAYRFGDDLLLDVLTAVHNGRTMRVTGVGSQANAVALLREFLGWRESGVPT